MRFIWSLFDKNRETLNTYYKYKSVEDKGDKGVEYLIKIYDEDQIMRDILLKIVDKEQVKGDNYPYSLIYKDRDFFIYSGYQNNSKEENSEEVAKMEINFHFLKEVPAYYCKDIKDIGSGDIVRLQYLQEKAEEKAEENKNISLNLALVNVNKVKNNIRIPYASGDKSKLCFLKDTGIEGHSCKYRTEAYCLWDIEQYIDK